MDRDVSVVSRIDNGGVRALDAVYERIRRDFTRNDRAWSRVVLPAFREVMKPFRDTLKRSTPRRTGMLRRAVGTEDNKRRRTLRVGYRYDRNVQRYMKQVAIEFGLRTRNYPARSPIRGSWTASRIDHDVLAEALERKFDAYLTKLKVKGTRITRR